MKPPNLKSFVVFHTACLLDLHQTMFGGRDGALTWDWPSDINPER
jgi:hypothetical protein